VKLSESALKLMGKNGNIKDVVANLAEVQNTLQVISTQKDVLNDKLADYAFFPISHVLRQLEKIPVRAQELTLECLSILLGTAWETHMAPELGVQLLILFSFITDQKGAKSSEELQALTFHCLAAVFSSLGQDEKGREALTNIANVPHLGKAASIILDGALDGSSDTIQLSAVSALRAFCRALSDRDALATSFLPGIMSCLTKILTPKASRRSSKMITACLEVLTELLPQIFSDEVTRKLPESAKKTSNKHQLDQNWLKATAPQIKMAFSNILKLRQHDRLNVRHSLAKLCMTLLEQCRRALSESISMMLETVVTLAGEDETIQRQLKQLLATEQDFTEAVRTSLHYWIISLPRIMQSADDTAKRRRMQQISLSYKLLSDQGVDMSIVDGDMAAHLRDSVFNAIYDSKRAPSNMVEYAIEVPSMEIAHLSQVQSTAFEHVLAAKKSQLEMINEISRFVLQLSTNSNSLEIVQDLVNGLHTSSGDLQLSNYWLSLNILRQSLNSTLLVDDILDFGTGQPNQKEDLLEQLYDFSIGILTDISSTSDRDWRFQALALETLALQARQQKVDFRTELIEALYPVLHLIGSSSPQLRTHAITCLNIMAAESGYRNSGELVVANVDYLVNAVALRLNTFDISPQAPQVLLMMVKLSGPSLLPYLDDLVDSMFAALEHFHGYPKLAELLFSVLKVIVEEGVKTPLLAITAGKAVEPHRKQPVQPMNGTDLTALLISIRKIQDDAKQIDMTETSAPQRPWKDTPSIRIKQDEELDVDEGESRLDERSDSKELEKKPPAPKTYSLLLNISKLTQHYLTSSSPVLRTSLLSLLDTTFPALAKHENSFLPLINTLWPVLLSRLEDTEAYVVSGALDVIRAMCVNAGDFMSGRISEAWSTIKKIYRTRTGKAGARMISSQLIGPSSKDIEAIVSRRGNEVSPRSGQQDYIDAPSRIIWESLVQLLTSIVDFVAIDDDCFEDIVDILAPVVATRSDVQTALEGRNPDAVWLALWRMGAQKPNDALTTQDFSVSKPATLTSKPQWRFAEKV
jgi:hypothetical protein